VSEELVIQSHKGPYSVHFDEAVLSDAARLLEGEPHFLIDANVARLYQHDLRAILDHPNAITIDATEENKSLERTIPVFERLVLNRIRRDHTLIAIGGGIIQDITCFVASTLLRGVPWSFVPTTLLAQADSCIGSKSSINLGVTKNILGTFYPPRRVFIASRFLETLDPKAVRSGIGEIVKVHAIDGVAAFDALANDFDGLFENDVLLRRYIRAALRIKQRFIEQDEFDRGIRNVFNYGHSFGHAIESATHYAVPHGIAVALGMDLANSLAVKRALLPAIHHARMHGVLRRLYDEYAGLSVSPDAVLSALTKDKKNTRTALGLIFPVGSEATIERVMVAPDAAFDSEFRDAFAEVFE
jgi:3-dehydroquinate synthetase